MIGLIKECYQRLKSGCEYDFLPNNTLTSVSSPKSHCERGSMNTVASKLSFKITLEPLSVLKERYEYGLINVQFFAKYEGESISTRTLVIL